MKARTWVAVSTLALIAGLGLVDLERASPGPLSAVHGSLPELAGGQDCAACHGGWFGDQTSACLECHEGIEDDLELGTGLHGTQPEGLDPERCGLCHGEHNGGGFSIAGPRAFAIAGVGLREDIDHGRFGQALEGAHLELECAECHSAADMDVLPEGTQRFRGLDTSCAACHESEHPPAFGGDCATCHGQADFATPEWSDHGRVFGLEGVHGEAACADCHDGAHDLEQQLLRVADGLEAEPRGCAACHEAPHSAGFLAASAPADEQASSCALCHDTAAGVFLDAAEDFDAERHAAAGFELTGPHDGLDCAACHGEAEAFADRHQGRVADDCAACHLDPHGAQFVVTDSTTRVACLDCHEREAFAPTSFDVERHAELALGLDGAHGELACDACHAPLEGAVVPSTDDAFVQQLERLVAVDSFPTERPRLGFRGTDPTCAACHDDAHAGFFGAADCAGCHGVEAFAPAGPGFDHGRDCGFTLGGAHGQGACADCHGEGPTPGSFAGFLGATDESPRLERRAHTALDQDCARCHASPHGDAFAVDGSGPDGGPEAEEPGAEDCAACHEPVSFTLAAADFDHGATGFGLDGRHGELDCGACHGTDWQPDEHGAMVPTRRVLAGASCTTCHEDPHAGQFEGPDACARCHGPARGFVEPTFHHDFDSRFRLEERHAELACGACHQPEEDAAGAAFVRYRPLSVECNSCHGVQRDGGLRRSGG